MRRFSPVLALTALAAATVGLAQQPPPPAGPATPPSTTQPSDPGASTDSESSQTNKQALMKDCMTQVRAANPGVPDKDIKNFCDKQINQPSPPHD